MAFTCQVLSAEASSVFDGFVALMGLLAATASTGWTKLQCAAKHSVLPLSLKLLLCLRKEKEG